MESIRETYVKIFSGEEKKGGVGTLLGVYLPTLLTMIGVCLYLRLGFVIGHAGLFQTVCILSLGLIMTLVTAISIASAASNMKIKEGGTYFMISRSFGLEVGASTGIALYLAHTMMLALCILGFSDSLLYFIPGASVKVIGSIVLIVLTALAYFLTNFALKMQVGIVFLVGLSSLFFITGVYSPKEVGTPGSISLSFWSVLAMIYPCLTGIEAGAAMSGDLKTPTRSITIGTILASITGFIFYVGLSWLLADKVAVEHLQSDPRVIENILKNNPILLSGLWAASLASALGCLLSAPRTFRAMALDGLFPKWIAYPYGDLEVPKVATVITAALAALLICFGSIQAVVLLLTMVLLIIYGLLNMATAIEALVGNPSWRPTFRISPYVSLFGAFLCLISMLMMDAGQTFIALFLIMMIYYAVKKRGVSSKWDDLRQTILFSLARYAIYGLAHTKQSLRSWRPNFLILSENGSMRSPLLSWARYMTEGHGFLTVASILRKESCDFDEIERWEKVIFENLKKRDIEALVEVSIGDNLAEGARNMIANYGVGSLAPNTVVLGECIKKEVFESYIGILEMAATARKNVLVIRGDIEQCKEQEIDIWWDDRRKDNSELMVLLSQLLLQSKRWRKAKITLKSIVHTEKALEVRDQYFEQFCKESRLRMTSRVYLVPNEEDSRGTISHMSTKSGIVFLSLLAPDQVEDGSYGDYYLKLMEDFHDMPTICFVICKQNIDIHTILS